MAKAALPRTCPGCGAALPVQGAASCAACGREVTSATSVRLRVAAMTQTLKAVAPSPRTILVYFVFPTLLFAAVLIPAAIQGVRQMKAATAAPAPFAEGEAAEEEPAALPALLVWGTRAAPVPVESEGGVEDVAGTFSLVDRKTGVATRHAGLLAGDTLTPRWQVPVEGELWEPALTLTLVAGRLLLTDASGQARVLEAPTGRVLAELKLPAAAKGACAASSGKAEAYLALANDTFLLVDLAQGRAAPARRPGSCAGSSASPEDAECALVEPTRATCKGKRHLPALPGFAGARLFSAGDLRVAVGTVRDNAPALVGLAARGRELWRHELPGAEPGAPELVDLLEGRVLVAIARAGGAGPEREISIEALDGAKGTRLWTASLGRSSTLPTRLVASRRRLYVALWTSLVVLDLETGAQVGRLGE